MQKFLSRFGPAIIVAAVVLGPGSILTSSKVGCEYGYSMLWVIALAVLLMIGATALSARLGATLELTPCQELARSLGKPVSILIGVILFLVVAAFQSSNNIAVIAALDPLLPQPSENYPAAQLNWLKAGILIGMNLLIVATLYGFSQLYQKLEKLMIALMVLMIIGFGINLFMAQPAISDVAKGMIPSLPKATAEASTSDSYLAILGMIGTTFSIAGAFYQAYLVREKGWSIKDAQTGLADSITGIAALGLTTMMIMCTSAAVLYGRVDPKELSSVTDVARQLSPLFGENATYLFIAGIFAGAFSSFLVNATIGGVLLSDGLNLGASLDQKWPKLFTVLALFAGMAVTLAMILADWNRVTLIIIAQALTVLGGPILAASLLYLALSKRYRKTVGAPAWMIALMVLGFICVSIVAVRTAINVNEKIQTEFMKPKVEEVTQNSVGQASNMSLIDSQVGQAPACLPTTIVEWSDWACNNHPPIKFSKTRKDYGEPL